MGILMRYPAVFSFISLGLLIFGASPMPSEDLEVVVTFQNLLPEEIVIDSVWVGFEDGAYDIYDPDAGPGKGVSWLATTGRAQVLAAEFAASGHGAVSSTLTFPEAAPVAPGERTSRIFVLDPTDEMSRYLVFAAHLSSEEGTFVIADNPVAYPVFDENAVFVGTSFLITDRQVFSVMDSGDYEGEPDGPGDLLDGPNDPEDEVGAVASGVQEGTAGSLGALELARITVRLPSEEEQEAAMNLEEDPIESAFLLEETRLDPFEETAAEGAEPRMEEEESSAAPEAAKDDSVEELDLNRWDRYAEDPEGGEDRSGRSRD